MSAIRTTTVPQSELRLIKHAAEYLEKQAIDSLPKRLRGIYVLYEQNGDSATAYHYDVVYVGMAYAGIRRLLTHRKTKGELWSHCSGYEVWDNVSDDEIAELEGLFRHIYRHDSGANALNKQKGYKKMMRVRLQTALDWDL